MKICHNKKRNLGLIHEFLNMEFTNAIIENNLNRASIALVILEKIFSNKFLNEELTLHLEVLKHTGVSQTLARKIVDELRHSGLIRNSKNKFITENAKKYIVQEINKKLGSDFFDKYRSELYKVHSSINILMNSSSRKINESIELAKIEEYLTKHLANSSNNSDKDLNEQIDIESYKNALSLYEKNNKDLPPKIKELLKEYIKVCLCINNNKFSIVAENQLNELRKNFIKYVNKNTSDTELNEKLEYAIREIDHIDNFNNAENVAKKIVLLHDINEQITLK